MTLRYASFTLSGALASLSSFCRSSDRRAGSPHVPSLLSLADNTRATTSPLFQLPDYVVTPDAARLANIIIAVQSNDPSSLEQLLTVSELAHLLAPIAPVGRRGLFRFRHLPLALPFASGHSRVCIPLLLLAFASAATPGSVLLVALAAARALL